MDDRQLLITELMKLKLHLVKELSSHTFRVSAEDMLFRVNEIIKLVEKDETA